MQIKSVTPKPFENSIPPGISFKIEIVHVKFQEAIVGIEGWLTSDDGKILAKVGEALPEAATSDEIGARGSTNDSQFKETVYNSTFIVPLGKKALNYIEKRRMDNEKRDVFFTLRLNIRTIQSKAIISHLHEIDSRSITTQPVEVTRHSGVKTKANLIAYVHDPDFYSDRSNRWVISGNRGQVFLNVLSQSFEKSGIRIPSTDWIHDYAPKLELGEYFIVEILKGKKVIKKAWEYIEKAEECYRQWDTKGAYANCREVGKLLNELIKKKFKNNPIIKKWKRAIEKFNTFASLDLHVEDIIKERPEGEIVIGRSDTEHILFVTKALIKYVQELLLEKD